MKNRLLAVLLAAVLLCALSLPVYANAAVMETDSAPTNAETVQDTNAIAPSAGEPDPAAPIQNNTARIELPTFNVPCRNAILIEADTGDVLYEKLPDAQVSIASITKVMTLLLTLEAVEAGKITLQDIVPISVHAYNMGGSQIWLEPGEQFTLDELIKAICVCSANDAAVAVAEYVGGSEPVFADMMNARAAELGMQNSHFVNACGLDIEGHYSSARDVAIMSAALLRHPLILEYCGIWSDTLRGGKTQLVNTNRLLNRYPGITGLKTGTTGQAGVCISATATRDGTSLISVVLGADSGDFRFAAATLMLDYGFATYEYAPFPAVQGAPANIEVNHGARQELSLVYGIPSGVLCRKGEGAQLTATYSMPQALDAPVDEGAEVGVVTLLLGETTLAQYPVLAEDAVPKMDFFTAIAQLLASTFSM